MDPTNNFVELKEKIEERSFSNGVILCSDLVSDSGMVNCNFHFLENVDSNVGKETWEAISNLGVIPVDKVKDYKVKINEMEKFDKERLTGNKVFNNKWK